MQRPIEYVLEPLNRGDVRYQFVGGVAVVLQDFDQSFYGVRRRQTLLGLKLPPAQRLRWLEEAIETFKAWKRRACHKQHL